MTFESELDTITNDGGHHRQLPKPLHDLADRHTRRAERRLALESMFAHRDRNTTDSMRSVRSATREGWNSIRHAC